MLSKKLYAIMAFLVAFALIAPVFATWTYPALDEIRFANIDNPSPHLAAMLAGELEWMPDIVGVGDLNTLTTENFQVYFVAGFHYCSIQINCRDVIPSTGTWRPPGTPLYPLNLTAFRQALAYLTPKTEYIPTAYGPIVRIVNSFIQPSQAYWYNPDVIKIYDYDPLAAYNTLIDAGFHNETGLWMTPKGPELRAITVMSPTAPTTIALCAATVTKWQAFFGVGYFTHLSGRTDISTRMFKDRDFDISILCWGMGRDPSLYAPFHSSMDVYNGVNSHGVVNATLNYWLENFWFNTTKEGAKASADVCIELLTDLVPCIPMYSRNYIHATDRSIAPGPPRQFERLTGVVPSPGYSAYNTYTFNLLDWVNPALPKWARISTGSMTYYTTTNPCLATWTYEWRVLNEITDGLMAVDPYTHQDMPWIATDWNYTFGSWPTLGIPTAGMKVTFWLRNDVYWQCGEPFTSADVAFSWNYLKDHQVPRMVSDTQYLTYVQAEGPYKVSCYLNTTSIFIWNDFAGLGCLLPKHIWENVTDFTTFDNTAPHPNPPPEYPYLTKACGVGPFIFHDWNKIANYVYVEANRGVAGKPYWAAKGPANPLVKIEDGSSTFYVQVLNLKNTTITPTVTVYVDDVVKATATPTIRGINYTKLGPYDTGEMGGTLTKAHNITVTATGSDTATYQTKLTEREDINYDFFVNAKDAVLLGKAFNSRAIPPEPTWDPRADINGDFFVNAKDAVLLGKVFNWPS
jgi:peptide/nickel transport system substrate-binding protein